MLNFLSLSSSFEEESDPCMPCKRFNATGDERITPWAVNLGDPVLQERPFDIDFLSSNLCAEDLEHPLIGILKLSSS